MIAQMAATAGSVAIGSTIGHGLSSMLFGGGGSSAATEHQAPPVQQQTHQQQTGGISCEIQAKGNISTHRLPIPYLTFLFFKRLYKLPREG